MREHDSERVTVSTLPLDSHELNKQTNKQTNIVSSDHPVATTKLTASQSLLPVGL